MRTLGGLFSGIGGFELAWQQSGGRVAWMCEIDRAARKVLAARFPGVPIYEDVTQLDPDEVEPVDVLTGGSPCQGFSIAGAREGLGHGESRLFADYVRIMDGLAARGLSYAIWENVPGVLSIENADGERTFEHVVAALVGADVPVRLDRTVRWNTGLADGGGRAVAWRVVDSRHFGVPQRRRRMYAVVAFGRAAADRAGRAILAVPEGVRGDTQACSQAGQGVAGTAGRSARNGGRAGSLTASPDLAVQWQAGGDHTSSGAFYDDGTTPTLSRQQTPAVLLTMREGKDGGGKGPLLAQDESLTLATGNSQVLFEPQGVDIYNQSVTGGISQTLDTDGKAAVLTPTGNSQVLFEPQGIAENQRGELVTTDYAHAVTSGGGKPGQGYPAALTRYGVRRLTPVEAERLQGFPDGWTEPAGSDSVRYRALGNAVTVNVPRWLYSRLPWEQVSLGPCPHSHGHTSRVTDGAAHTEGGSRVGGYLSQCPLITPHSRERTGVAAPANTTTGESGWVG